MLCFEEESGHSLKPPRHPWSVAHTPVIKVMEKSGRNSLAGLASRNLGTAPGSSTGSWSIPAHEREEGLSRRLATLLDTAYHQLRSEHARVGHATQHKTRQDKTRQRDGELLEVRSE